MNKTEGRRKGFWPGVIFIAFVAAMVTFLVMLQVEKNALSAYEKVSVWCAQKELVNGTQITEQNWSEYFAQVEIDKNRVPEKAVALPETIWGQETQIIIPKGTVLSATMFADTEHYVDKLHNPVVVGCKGEDLFQMVSGVLRKGDLVHIYTVDEENKQTYLLWENVPIYQVFDAAGNMIASTDSTTPAARVNLLLEKGRAGQFYNELNNGSLRLVQVKE